MSELATKYQQKTDRQHILDKPDTYIGSVECVDYDTWVSEEDYRIVQRTIAYVPGLFKLFDEGIVNCRDHVVRMQSEVAKNVPQSLPVTFIDVSVNAEDGTITMVNDGNGIDVAEHPEYKIWIPELIFGHLRTSTNYDDSEKKIVGGKNGFGFKLVLIWSSYGYIETVDHKRGLKYCQTFENNLEIIGKPSITKSTVKKPYTKIVFRPDYARFGQTLSADMIALLRKRVLDIGAVTDKTVKVRYNGQLVPTKNFLQYVGLYLGQQASESGEDNTSNIAQKPVYEEANERWEYAVVLSPNHEFMQVSFVNGIATAKGGKHVEYVLNQITRKMGDFIEKKKKIKVNPNSIKEQLFLFLRCDIENPAFDSQTKDFMNTPVVKFGSSCTVSDKFIEKLAKMGVMEAACALTEVKESKAAKKTDGTKSKNIRGIPKLVDANWAGTEKSKQCMIIFCEGDSAKAGIISGLSSEDRNTIGVYPLKGKVMNVRGEAVKKVSDNKEIAEIKKILGLETGRDYKTLDDVHNHLRYSRVLFMTDQDLDGSHIKGLCINLFQCMWPSLYHLPGFIGFMNTPILKARRANDERVFYNNGEFDRWKEENNDGRGWHIKYYKGLGTSTGKEFREYFATKKIVGFLHTGEPSDDAIDMVFNKKRADHRKEWLGNYDRSLFLDTARESIPYEEFVHREFIHFSKYDNDRSIPNLMDGLKISLRKILFAAFKKNLTSEIKVAQFTGYVSEQACYHHGEASLNQAIVGLAQNFVGSNNINLLVPSGQFGTRLQGGKDSASERYIFTRLHKITRCIFPDSDDAVLQYLEDDGTQVEPIYYVPILPMVLVNGAKGIGTGFSTDIMCYNPKDIIAYLRQKLTDSQQHISVDFLPFYQGFKGTVEKVGDTKFVFRGVYEKMGVDKIRVTELPVGFWTQDFKEHLECLQESVDKDGKKTTPIIKDYDDMSKDSTVDFVITFCKGKLEELEAQQELEKVLKLTSSNSTTNMNLFDAKDKLKKYDRVQDIIDDYFVTRLDHYDLRKKHLIAALEKQLTVLENKARYIGEVLEGTIDLRKRRREEISLLLSSKGYAVVESDVEYKYLIKMAMDSVSEDNVAKLQQEFQNKAKELADVRSTTIQQMWLGELDTLEKEYDLFVEERDREKATKPKITKIHGAQSAKKRALGK